MGGDLAVIPSDRARFHDHVLSNWQVDHASSRLIRLIRGVSERVKVEPGEDIRVPRVEFDDPSRFWLAPWGWAGAVDVLRTQEQTALVELIVADIRAYEPTVFQYEEKGRSSSQKINSGPFFPAHTASQLAQYE
jgi:hypothetical protein